MAQAHFRFPHQPVSDHATALRVEVRHFLAEFAPSWSPQTRAKSWVGFDRAFSLAVGARGWIGMTWPKAYGGQPEFSAAETIQSYRHTVVSARDLAIIRDLRQRGEIQTLGSVKAAYANPALGMAKACAMAVQRIIDIDLTDGLHDGVLVRILGEDRHD